jgi:GR25 family glycosyltransferase involved in LPS biosynthesis
MWYRRQRQYRSKIAIDMSHYRMLERVAASNRSTLILEDDAKLTGEKWLPDLLTALQQLPEVRRECSCWLS